MSARSERRRAAAAASGTPAARPLPNAPLPILLLGLLAAAIAFLPLIRTLLHPPEARADGYSSIVTAAIAEGWLYPVPSQGEAGDADGRVERARGGDVPASFDRFIATSYLREDMATLDPAIWRYDGSRLGIDPRAHVVGGAYDGVSGWRGSLLFADTQVTQQLLDERGTPIAWLIASPRPGAAGRPRQIDLMRTAAPVNPDAEERAEADSTTDLTFIANIDGAPTAIAHLRRIGGSAVLRVPRRDRDSVSVRIGSRDAAPGGAYQVAWRLLESGDSLSFAWPGGARRFQFVQSEPAISRARGDAARVRDPSLASLARSVEYAVGTGANSLQTSLQSRLHAVAQQALETQAMALYGSDTVTSFRAAAVLMDGLTGEVAALPSFPVAQEQLHPSQRGSPSHRKMLDRNSNFVRLVAGSAAKPPMAMAVVNAFPALTTLTISRTDPFRQLVGIDLGVPVPDRGPGGDWDFTTFLANSSNKYAAALMLLGLSDADSLRSGACEGPSNEAWTLSGQRRDCRPPMRFLESATPGQNGLVAVHSGQPAGQGWANQLYTLFCIAPNSPDDPPPVGDAACLPDDSNRRPLWRGASFQRPRLLANASPDREGFGLGVVDSLYEDYVMTILGGNRGRWTTLGLAQAYARILTGKAVTARLTQHSEDSGEEPPASLPVNGQAQRALIEGLKAVVLQGTGRGLIAAGFPATAGGDEFRFFAKTGTPNVAFLGEDSRALLRDFAASGCGLRLVSRAPREGAPARALLTVGEDAAIPPARAIAARPECNNRFGTSANRIAELVQQINANPAALRQITADPSGRVTGVPAQIALGEGTGHVMVLMIGRYRPGTPDTAPCSLRTVAINFQARTASERTPALRYAVSLLRNEIVRNWFMGTPCQGGAA